jgi:hypothetical protein
LTVVSPNANVVVPRYAAASETNVVQVTSTNAEAPTLLDPLTIDKALEIAACAAGSVVIKMVASDVVTVRIVDAEDGL